MLIITTYFGIEKLLLIMCLVSILFHLFRVPFKQWNGFKDRNKMSVTQKNEHRIQLYHTMQKNGRFKHAFSDFFLVCPCVFIDVVSSLKVSLRLWYCPMIVSTVIAKSKRNTGQTRFQIENMKLKFRLGLLWCDNQNKWCLSTSLVPDDVFSNSVTVRNACSAQKL